MMPPAYPAPSPAKASSLWQKGNRMSLILIISVPVSGFPLSGVFHIKYPLRKANKLDY
jgi:hypothetical protein